MLILTTGIEGSEMILGTCKDDRIVDAYPLKQRDDRNRVTYVINFADDTQTFINQTGWDQLKKACVNYEK